MFIPKYRHKVLYGKTRCKSDQGAGEVVVLWIAPTTDWSGQIENANNDWTKGAVELSIDLEGQCPIPTKDTQTIADEASFAYYMAYFKAYNDGTPAKLIGTTCPECGVMNP